MQFINSPADMAWLADVFKLPGEWGSAIIYGNEDAPSRVELFYSAEPDVYQAPDKVILPNWVFFTPSYPIAKNYRG